MARTELRVPQARPAPREQLVPRAPPVRRGPQGIPGNDGADGRDGDQAYLQGLLARRELQDLRAPPVPRCC